MRLKYITRISRKVRVGKYEKLMLGGYIYLWCCKTIHSIVSNCCFQNPWKFKIKFDIQLSKRQFSSKMSTRSQKRKSVQQENSGNLQENGEVALFQVLLSVKLGRSLKSELEIKLLLLINIVYRLRHCRLRPKLWRTRTRWCSGLSLRWRTWRCCSWFYCREAFERRTCWWFWLLPEMIFLLFLYFTSKNIFFLFTRKNKNSPIKLIQSEHFLIQRCTATSFKNTNGGLCGSAYYQIKQVRILLSCLNFQ